MKSVITEANKGQLLRDYLYEDLRISTRLIKKVKAYPNGLLINDKRQTVRYVLQVSDVVKVTFPPEEISESLIAEKMDLQIVYEDEAILVVNKRAGMPTMPSRLHTSGTLANGVLGYYREQKIPFTIHVVTRLDKDTSGLVLIAKHQFSHSLFSNMQRQNQIKRKYQAFISGQIKPNKGTIDLPIGRKPDSIIERMVVENGQTAITHYEVVNESDQFSFVEVELETGRTHQIRVHFAYLGHPLLGDDLYGGNLDTLKRQGLHCHKLGFVHPFTDAYVTFLAPLADDMMNLSNEYSKNV